MKIVYNKSMKDEKEIDFLRDKYKNYFLILLGLLTGEATVIYAVITGEKPVFTLFLAILGFIFLAILSGEIKRIEDEIYTKLDKI